MPTSFVLDSLSQVAFCYRLLSETREPSAGTMKKASILLFCLAAVGEAEAKKTKTTTTTISATIATISTNLSPLSTVINIGTRTSLTLYVICDSTAAKFYVESDSYHSDSINVFSTQKLSEW